MLLEEVEVLGIVGVEFMVKLCPVAE